VWHVSQGSGSKLLKLSDSWAICEMYKITSINDYCNTKMYITVKFLEKEMFCFYHAKTKLSDRMTNGMQGDKKSRLTGIGYWLKHFIVDKISMCLCHELNTSHPVYS
jgi:hypothetical protein